MGSRHFKYGLLSLAGALLISCAPIQDQRGLQSSIGLASSGLANNGRGASARIGQAPSYFQRVSFVNQARAAMRNNQAPTNNTMKVFGVEIPLPKIPTLSQIAKRLQGEDEPIDQPVKQLQFPTVDDYPPPNPTGTASEEDPVLDERSLMLLAEAERIYGTRADPSVKDFAMRDFTSNPFVDSLNEQTLAQRSQLGFSKQLVLVVVALCVLVLLTCAYFVVSYLFDEMRVKKSKQFGSKW